MGLLKPARGIRINRSHPLARNLTGCWLFNEGAGQYVHDMGPYHQAAGFLGGPPLWKPGLHGHCIQFDGSEECIDIATGKFGFDATNELSVVALVNQYASHVGIMFTRSAFVRPIKLETATNGEFKLYVYTDSDNCLLTSSSVHATDGSEWCHVAGTWKQHDGRIYVNGNLENSESASNGNLSFINDSQPVGIGGIYEAGSYYYCYQGAIEYVFVYNRALSTDEIKSLYREPFSMFDHCISPALVTAPVNIVSLAGSINAKSTVTGTLSVLMSNRQYMERRWLTDALFNGMTANAIKLGTILSMGWFWTRVAGCTALYRGSDMSKIDFSDILAVAGQNASEISPPCYLPHNNDSTYYYIVRRFNNCGCEELTLAAAAKVSINIDGELSPPQPNKIFTLKAEQVECSKIKLTWFYCPIEQKSQPARFNIYSDGGTGQLDYENQLASIDYQGRIFYRFTTDCLEAARYMFAVRAEDADSTENDSQAKLCIQLDAANPNPIEILSTTGV